MSYFHDFISNFNLDLIKSKSINIITYLKKALNIFSLIFTIISLYAIYREPILWDLLLNELSIKNIPILEKVKASLPMIPTKEEVIVETVNTNNPQNSTKVNYVIFAALVGLVGFIAGCWAQHLVKSNLLNSMFDTTLLFKPEPPANTELRISPGLVKTLAQQGNIDPPDVNQEVAHTDMSNQEVNTNKTDVSNNNNERPYTSFLQKARGMWSNQYWVGTETTVPPSTTNK